MPKRLPNKLPAVSGQGPAAQGFRLAFDRINEIIDYLESITPTQSVGVLTSHTILGVTRTAKPGNEEQAATSDEESRWA